MVTQKQDGSADGRATFRDADANTRIDVQIDCMSFNPTTCADCDPDSKSAALTGVVTSSNDHFFPAGTNVGFVVQDNGQGRNASPDQFKLLTSLKDRCWPIHSPFLESERGVILVDPGQ